jgi:hypothetical protein
VSASSMSECEFAEALERDYEEEGTGTADD